MDTTKFEAYLNSIFQNGFVMLSMGLGHKLGLFECLINSKKPLSVTDIADGLALKERYTKEWLSSMVAAGIIKQDRETNMYTIPESYKPVLKMSASFSPILALCSKKTNKLLQCFKKDGPYGIDYQDSPDFFDWFDDYRETMCESSVENEVLPQFSKQEDTIPRLEKGIRVIDIGSGSGNFTNVLAKKFPNSTYVGLEYTTRGIDLSNKAKAAFGLTNVEFVQGDAHNLPKEWTESFDMVLAYDVLHDLPNPHKALDEIYRVLKQDGYVTIIDMGFHSNPVDNADDPVAAMYYSVSMFICLASSMTEEPHVGYGACWGVEEIEKALVEAKLKLCGKTTLVLVEPKTFFFCKK